MSTTGQSSCLRPGFVAFVFTLLLWPLMATASDAKEASLHAPGHDEGAGPDRAEAGTPPGDFHGNWRVVARDDAHDQALMRLSIQHGRGDRLGSGDYVLFQPFCDALVHAPITGNSDCEAIGASDAFERVQLRRRWLVLVFRPTADGQPHTLALRRAGERLVGEYRNGDGARSVVVQPVD